MSGGNYARWLLLAPVTVGLSGCENKSSLAAQNDRQATEPYFAVTDNHGCKWRISLRADSFTESYPLIKADGTVDCPQTPTPEQKP